MDKLVTLRKTQRAERKVALVIFNFPPHAGNTGTAANLSVFRSIFNTLQAMQAQGYSVDVPADVDALRSAILEGNAQQYGTMTNIQATISADDHVAREPYLEEIEAQWGPAPGKDLTDGRSIFIMGAQFGNVMVGVQPGFGYEGDPMRLLFERGFAPTHAFSAFYRYLRDDFGANSVLHFGTHGALEFMPGKQTGMAGSCWPDRLISDLPNYYLYASNNPSEGLIAKRRSAATLISYMTPPITQSDLYQGMLELKASIDRWRSEQDRGSVARDDLAALIQLQASALDLCAASPAWTERSGDAIEALRRELLEVEQTLIPHGLHVVGEVPSQSEKSDLLQAIAHASHGLTLNEQACEALLEGAPAQDLAALLDAGDRSTEEWLAVCQELSRTATLLDNSGELDAILHALDGGFIRPAPGGDLLRTPDVLPTGRNVHGFDPFRLPSAFAMRDARRQTQNLLDRHAGEGNGLPESVALV
ncbi:MAG: cobaltochelatase subunit CobN, partial [Gammaproteobacteria bacterium]